MHRGLVHLALLVPLFAATVGCDNDNGNGADLGAADLGGAALFDQGFARATEADVASILLTVNAGEIMVAEAAQPGLATQAAKDYAQMMIDMHSAARTRQLALFQQLAITPNDANPFTQMLMVETARILTIIPNLGGVELDRFYVDTQVQMHQSALDLVDFVLLPNSATPALVQELMTTRTAIVQHLALAKQLQSSLAGDGGV